MDIPLVYITASNDGNADKKKQFTLQTGILSSALEHAVPEQLFVNAQNPGEAISAVKALQKAGAAGQHIYHITPANQSAILGNIHHDSDTMNEIRNALNAGKEVITHTDAVSVPGWPGAGYIITDPVTGAGAFKIAGGGNGFFFAAGVFHGTAVGLTLFYLSAAYSDSSGNPKALAYAAAALAIFLEEIAIVIATHEAYGHFFGADAQACYLAGIGLGLIAAGITTDILEKYGNINTSSLAVKFLSKAIGVALAFQNISPAQNCTE